MKHIFKHDISLKNTMLWLAITFLIFVGSHNFHGINIHVRSLYCRCAARHDELSTEDRSIIGGIYARSCIAFFSIGNLQNAEKAGIF